LKFCERSFVTRSSVFHKLDPRTKLGLILLVTIVSVKLESFVCLFILALVLLICMYLAKIFKESLCLLKHFVVILGVVLSVSIIVKDINQTVCTGSFFARLFVMTIAGLLLALTTSPNDFAKALEKMRIPHPITFIFTATMRFVPTLLKEVEAIMDSLRLRGLRIRGRDILKTPSSFYRGICIPLTVRSIKISDELAAAAETRGFGSPNKRTSLREVKFRKNDHIFLFTMVVLSITLLIADKGVAIPW